MSAHTRELDEAVDAFAAEMKKRLRDKAAQGFRGWQHADRDELSMRLMNNAASGIINGDSVSLVDAANLAMMIHRRIP